MTDVTIYTISPCPFCTAAKALLRKKGVAFTEINVSNDPATRSTMITKANGRRTVPQIFIGSMHVGGCDDLHALENAGTLDSLLDVS
jgi:glutaredoxin 3